MDITHTATTTRTATTGRIRTMAITGLTIRTVGIVITATIVTTIITDIKGDAGSRNELARKQFRASFFLGANLFAPGIRKKSRLYFFGLADSAGFVAGLLAGWSIWNSFFSC